MWDNETVHKLVILIEPPTDLVGFEESWPLFLHEAERMPGLLSEASIRVVDTLYGEHQIYKIHEFFFENRKNLKKAMTSPCGQAAGKILQQITNGKMMLLTADHWEDRFESD